MNRLQGRLEDRPTPMLMSAEGSHETSVSGKVWHYPCVCGLYMRSGLGGMGGMGPDDTGPHGGHGGHGVALKESTGAHSRYSGECLKGR